MRATPSRQAHKDSEVKKWLVKLIFQVDLGELTLDMKAAKLDQYSKVGVATCAAESSRSS